MPRALDALVFWAVLAITLLATSMLLFVQPTTRPAWLKANCARILTDPATPGNHPTARECQNYITKRRLEAAQ